jgi:hypothetical protein
VVCLERTRIEEEPRIEEEEPRIEEPRIKQKISSESKLEVLKDGWFGSHNCFFFFYLSV